MTWWNYLLLVNIYLLLFYGFYALLLRNETYFQLNRLYLVSAAMLSFCIPLIQAGWAQNLFITAKVHHTLYGGYDPPVIIYSSQSIQNTSITLGQMFIYLYLAGMVVLSLRLILQLIQVSKMIARPEPTTAFSFFNKISLGENIKEEAIMAHEQVHARQWHSIDVLIIEAVMIFNWFNPVVYFYRFAIKHIHEFIADRQALKVGADKKEYAMLLLSQTFHVPSHWLVNPFYNHSLLKQRIIMIQKNKSQRMVLIKYALSAPLFGLMLILSSATINNSNTVRVINSGAKSIFLQPAIPAINGVEDQGRIPANQISVDAGFAAKTTVSNKIAVAGNAISKSDDIYESVEIEPAFPGGQDKFYAFLAKTIKYPEEAEKEKISGKVFVQFVVEKDGSLSNIKAIRTPGYGLDDEAVKAIASSPNWKPGMQNGFKVRVAYTVPVTFSLTDVNGNIDNETNIPQQDNKVYESVEHEPSFIGGNGSFYDYLIKNIKYPEQARKQKIKGKVFVQFIVERNGAISNVKVVRGAGHGMDEEAERVMKACPNWKPGVQNGRPVRVEYTVPINFSI